MATAKRESGLVDEARVAGPARRWHLAVLAAIFLVALAVRVAAILLITPHPLDGRFDDTVWYHGSARLIADGRGYLNPYNETPTAKWAVGYPLLLAAFYKLPGNDEWTGKALNAFMGAVTSVLVYLLAERLWNRKVGLLAAAAMALFPSHILFTPLIMTEVTSTMLIVAVMWFTVAFTLDRARPPNVPVLLALGALLGVAATVRGEGPLLLALPAIAWLVAHRSLRRVGGYMLVAGAALSLFVGAWALRNEITLGSPIIGTTGLGGVLYQAHNPLADGRANLLTETSLGLRFPDMDPTEHEMKTNSTGIRDSIEFALENPRREVELTTERFAYFYNGDRGGVYWIQHPNGDGELPLSTRAQDILGGLSDAYYYVMIGFAVVGLPFWIWKRKASYIVPLALFLYYTVFWSVAFFGDPRFHVPLLPVFAIGGAAGVYFVVQAPFMIRRLVSHPAPAKV